MPRLMILNRLHSCPSTFQRLEDKDVTAYMIGNRYRIQDVNVYIISKFQIRVKHNFDIPFPPVILLIAKNYARNETAAIQKPGALC